MKIFLKLACFVIFLFWQSELFGRDLPVFPSQKNIKWREYKVKRGDTFWKLFKSDWLIVSRFNRIDERHLKIDTMIKVPKDLKSAKNYEPLPFFTEERKNVEKFILVDLKEQWIGLYEYGNLIFSTFISSGKSECEDPKNGKIRSCETPKGMFKTLAIHRDHISNRYRDADGNGIPMSFAVMFHYAAGVSYWFHDGDLPGYLDSHGCIRLKEEDAKKLCKWVYEKCLKTKDQIWLEKRKKITIIIK